jgi:hypothetical protein
MFITTNYNIKMNIKFFISFFILVLSGECFLQTQTVTNSTSKFEIVYQADVQYAVNPIWLKKIKDDWKATAINLRIYRYLVEQYDGTYNWNNKLYQVDSALKKISDAGLNIYIRINFSSLDNRTVYKQYSADDFQIRSNGKHFLNVYEVNNPLLNITSSKSRGDMLGFLSKVVDHLGTLPKGIQSKIKIIVPSLTPDDETELPFNTYDDSTQSIVYNVLSGFSRPEIAAFMKFLENKYNTVSALNESWGEGAQFSGFDSSQIRIRTYNWDGIKTDHNSFDYYKFENGRKDFLDFRRSELKRFIDDCSIIVKKAGFNFGVQFGSIYDGLIEFRGFYDPTPLIEKVDLLITDDILEYYPNFSFSADYARSLTKYWTWKNKSQKRIRFATESNWPGYADYNAMDLIKYWFQQLRTFYEKGASCLFISQWGTVGGPNNIAEKLLADSFKIDYSAWKDTLIKFWKMPVKIITNDFSYHLACEQGLSYRKASDNKNEGQPEYIHNDGFIKDKLNGKNIIEFPLVKFSKLRMQNEKTTVYNDKGDFVTNYMLMESPDYLKKNYKKFYFTETSVFLPKNINFEF